MKHEYSTQQIEEASDLASNGYTRIGINFLLDFLNHLPEPETDEWQECRFEDIQKGDRVKRVLIYDSGTAEIREGVVANKDAHFASCTQNRILSSSEDLNSTIVKLYRIPAPVQHPDPAEHPVIYVKDCDIVGFIPKIMVWYRDSYVAGRQCVSPERITDWQQIDPAKVVEDDR